MANTKIVNIVANIPIRTMKPPLQGRAEHVELTTADILKCLNARAYVEEVLENGDTVPLSLANYCSSNGPAAAITKVVKTAEAKVEESVPVEEKKEEVPEVKEEEPAPAEEKAEEPAPVEEKKEEEAQVEDKRETASEKRKREKAEKAAKETEAKED